MALPRCRVLLLESFRFDYAHDFSTGTTTRFFRLKLWRSHGSDQLFGHQVGIQDSAILVYGERDSTTVVIRTDGPATTVYCLGGPSEAYLRLWYYKHVVVLALVQLFLCVNCAKERATTSLYCVAYFGRQNIVIV